MTTSGLLWPTKDEYNLAIANWTSTVWDAELRSGNLAQDHLGICVFPIVKMPFLLGSPPLGEFIVDRYRDRVTMSRLSDAWLRMMHELESVSMAHGDLDLTNVLVED